MVRYLSFLLFSLFSCFASVHSQILGPYSSSNESTPSWLNINPSSALDLLSLNLTTPNSGGLDIKCSGSHFGFHPSVADCESAKGYIEPDTEQHVFGERHSGLMIDFPLPYRVMGGRPGSHLQSQIGVKCIERLITDMTFHKIEAYASSSLSLLETK